jgi:cation/acetate symporter
MSTSQAAFNSQLKRYYGLYTGGFVIFVLALAALEMMGVPNRILGYCFRSPRSACTR